MWTCAAYSANSQNRAYGRQRGAHQIHPSAPRYRVEEKLNSMGYAVYHHYTIEGYPSNISKIVSDEGYGKNDYIENSRASS
jgi:uncharacterized protein (UPF0371 family)